MDGYAAPLGDITSDRFERCRLAALRHLRQQPAHPADPHVVLAGFDASGLARDGWVIRSCRRRRQQILNFGHHLRGGQRAVTHGGKQLFRFGKVEFFRRFLQLELPNSQPLELPLQQRAAGDDAFILILLDKPLSDLGPRPIGLDIAQMWTKPVATRTAGLGGQHVHLLAILEFVSERHDAAVDLGAPTAMTDFGMDVVGEIQRCRSLRQFDDGTLGRDGVHPILERLGLEMLQQIAVAAFFLPIFQNLP